MLLLKRRINIYIIVYLYYLAYGKLLPVLGEACCTWLAKGSKGGSPLMES